jgi:hypothetical protein
MTQTTTSCQNTQPSAESAEFLFYCDMTALSHEERIAHQELIGQLFGTLVQETRELPEGYAYRFHNEHYHCWQHLLPMSSYAAHCTAFQRGTCKVP